MGLTWVISPNFYMAPFHPIYNWYSDPPLHDWSVVFVPNPMRSPMQPSGRCWKSAAVAAGKRWEAAIEQWKKTYDWCIYLHEWLIFLW